MGFTLKQVETFRTVYETESVTAAARRLDLSPATVSATLAALEASIEMRLFERVRQRMHRTPEATLLYEEIRRLSVGLESLGRKIRAIRGSAQPRLRVGCIHAYSGAIVATPSRAFASAIPIRRYTCRSAIPIPCATWSCRANWTWPPWPTNRSWKGCAATAWPVSRRWRCFPGPYADPAGTGRIRAAGRCRCDRVERGGRVRKRLDALLRQSGQALRISIETPYSSTVCQLALAGHGVGIAIRPRPGMEAAGLAFRPLAAPVHFECHMILHGSRPLSEAGKFWATCLRAALAPLDRALRRLRLAARARRCAGEPSRIRVHAIARGPAGLSRAGRLRSGSARPTTRRRACPSVAAA